MSTLTLYHGSSARIVRPAWGSGSDRHDYGRGFYLTESAELAREWAVCRPDERNGWLHQYELDTEGLNILDFEQEGVLSWLAELMKHREASDSRRYRVLAARFLEKYAIQTDGVDIIRGWRADASYFSLAKEFVRDNVDREILEELLQAGAPAIQYCIRSQMAYSRLREISDGCIPVQYAEFHEKYNQRDIAARRAMHKLINSDANKVLRVFSTLCQEGVQWQPTQRNI